jgi:hypothetical protein
MRPAFRSPIFAASIASATPASTNGKPNSAGWKSRAKRLRTVGDENTRRLLADAMLDNAALKETSWERT